MSKKGITKINNNDTPNNITDDFISYVVVGNHSGIDQTDYAILVANNAVQLIELDLFIKRE
ncbi:MAG: hypothetical protein R2753_01525 [Chitinophagales bacterium]